MPNPKRRFSHQRTALRRTNYTATMPEIEVVRKTGELRLRHCATPDGFYKGRILPGFKRKQS
jgi:ribosomal protein L32